MNFIMWMMFLGGLLGMLLNWEHILIMLLCLEFMNLGILYCIFILMMMGNLSLNLILYMFFIVCEAGLGLSILVGSVYFYGNDKISSMILLKC
uniref:NADH dehydrogenase subunit 4L n=1 Tax=Reticulinasus faini TaxID=1811739 RepID=UPI0007394B51|nr:NADH dehydrogenase subunit 4L [Reticulinasus faini]AIZ58552.1 NADH dehydrogenase subunit 4L [Reticulinasus faini]